MWGSLKAFLGGPGGRLAAAVSFLFTVISAVQFLSKSSSGWMWSSFALAALVALSFWRFHEQRRALDSKDEGQDHRYEGLSDLLGQSLTVGVDLSEKRDWRLLEAWKAHTRALVVGAYGEGEAAHIFTPELKGRKVHRGSISLAMMESPPPLAGTINSLRDLLGRLPTLAIRSAFKPADWTAFDPVAYRAENALRIRTIGEDDERSCPWCGVGIDDSATHCEVCGAELEGDWAYKASTPPARLSS
jgi:hypothetical protein